MKKLLATVLTVSFVLSACSRQVEDSSDSSDLGTFEQKNIAPNPKDEQQSKRRWEDGVARTALDCINRQYPRRYNAVLNSAEDLKSPIEQNPVFFGCTNLSGSIMAHWTLLRLWKQGSAPDLDGEIAGALNASFTAPKLQREADYIQQQGEDNIYALVWFLEIAGELKSVQGAKSEQAELWLQAMEPVTTTALRQVQNWLEQVDAPVRSGDENQTAMLLSMILDMGNAMNEPGLSRLASEKATSFYLEDQNCPVVYEPSGGDIFSACLSEAALMGRVLGEADYANWLSDFLPELNRDTLSTSSGKIGTNDDWRQELSLSKSWSLEQVLRSLPEGDARRDALHIAAENDLKLASDRFASSGAFDNQSHIQPHRLAAFLVYHAKIVSQPVAIAEIPNAS